jgi:hypothetical protein
MAVHKLGHMSDQPAGKTWRCQRQTGGQKCLHDNPSRLRKCQACGKPRPPRKRPDHMKALDLPYEHYIKINGGEFCGICGQTPKPGKRLHRDHDHRTGKPRGLLCFLDNRFLGNRVDGVWLRKAAWYLERHEDRVRLEERVA